MELESGRDSTAGALAENRLDAEIHIVDQFETEMPADAKRALDAIPDRVRPSALIIETDLLSHRPYVLWAMRRSIAYCSSSLGAARVKARLIRPEVERHYRVTERYEPLYALLRAVAGRVVVGDLGGHTLDPHRTVDACLCYGCSVGVATGMALADPSLHVICVTGDAAFLHSGKAAVEEALARGAAVTVIVLDNGGSQGTGGQRLPGTCRLNSPALEWHDLDFPAASEAGPLSALLDRPIRPRLIRLITPF